MIVWRPDPWFARPMSVTTMIANRFVRGGLVFSAETTRARVTGHILKG